METLIRFIEKVENRVLYYVTEYTEHQDTMDYFTDLWVHQLSGKVVFNDCPEKPNYKRAIVGHLCTIAKISARFRIRRPSRSGWRMKY